MRRRLTLAVIAAAGLTAQTSPDAIIRVETREVVVDVSVTGKGAAPGSLTAKDFSISEDGRAQKINSVSFAGAGSVNADPDTAQKHFVLYFDFTTMPMRDQAASQREAAAFVDAMASPDRYMAVVSLNAGGPHLIQGFTSARAILKSAVAVPVNSGSGAGGLNSRDLLASLDSLVRSLSPAPGRKALLIFTGGQSLSSAEPRVRALITACNRANVAAYVVLSNRSTSDAVESNNGRGRGAAFPAPSSALSANSDFASALAEETGGEVFPFSAKLPEELAGIARMQDEYYRVAYTPPAAKEGSCHALKVSLNLRGLTAKARNEYCTGKAIDVVAGKIAGQSLEARAAKRTGALDASLQLPWFYTGTNRATVRLVAAMVPAGMKFEKTKTGLHGEIDVVGTLLRPDGGTAARFADTVDIDVEDQQHADAFTRTPWRYQHPFQAAAGNYTFQLALGAGPDTVGNVEMPLVIEPRGAANLALSGIAFSTELRALEPNPDMPLLETHAPLMAGNREFVPAATNRLPQAGPAYFYTEIYDANPEGLAIQVRILDKGSGEARMDTGKAGASNYTGRSGPNIPFASGLPVEILPPGSYRLEITATHGSGPEVATRTAEFEVR